MENYTDHYLFKECNFFCLERIPSSGTGNGQLLRGIHYESDNSPPRIWVSGYGPFVAGKRSGHWKMIDPNAPFQDSNTVDQGLLPDEDLAKLPIREEGEYVDGKKHGEWRSYIILKGAINVYNMETYEMDKMVKIIMCRFEVPEDCDGDDITAYPVIHTNRLEGDTWVSETVWIR